MSYRPANAWQPQVMLDSVGQWHHRVMAPQPDGTWDWSSPSMTTHTRSAAVEAAISLARSLRLEAEGAQWEDVTP